MRRAAGVLLAMIVLLRMSSMIQPAHAFEMDLSPVEAAHRTGERLLGDMAVGERARFTYYTLNICRDETNSLLVSTTSRIYKDQDDHGGYMSFYEVERLSNGHVSLTSIAGKDKNSLVGMYQSLSVVMSCQLLAQMELFDMKSLLPIDTIDGKKSLSQLLPVP